MTLADRTSIVVGVDGSETSVNAALWAADLAQRMNVPLVLAHAVTTPAYYYTDAAEAIQYPLGETEREIAQACLEPVRIAVAARFPALRLSTWSQRGPADLALVAISRHAQLLVVGEHQKMSLESVVLGSTTARVVNHSECAVVVWRSRPGTGPVVVGVDGSPLSELAVERAFELASQYESGLHAVYAWDKEGIEGTTREAAEAVLAERLAGWREKYPEVKVTQLTAALRPEEALLEYSQNARLVVVGSHGRGRASSLFLGSTSRHLLRHSPCPVLVCRTATDDLA